MLDLYSQYEKYNFVTFFGKKYYLQNDHFCTYWSEDNLIRLTINIFTRISGKIYMTDTDVGDDNTKCFYAVISNDYYSYSGPISESFFGALNNLELTVSLARDLIYEITKDKKDFRVDKWCMMMAKFINRCGSHESGCSYQLALETLPRITVTELPECNCALRAAREYLKYKK